MLFNDLMINMETCKLKLFEKMCDPCRPCDNKIGKKFGKLMSL